MRDTLLKVPPENREPLQSESQAAVVRRLKLFFVIDRIIDDMGGTEGQVMKLVRGLQQTADVEVVVLQDSTWIGAQVSSDSLRFTILDLSGGFRRVSFWLGVAKLVRRLRQGRPDVVHTFFPIANIIGAVAARLAGVRAVVGSRRDYGYWITPGYLRATRLANRLVDNIVTNSPEVKRFTAAKEGFPADDIEVIYNGLELGGLRLPQPDSSLKARLGIPAQNKVIALVANIKPIKRHDTLVEAFGMLCQKREDLSLLFVGGGDAENLSQIRQHVERLGLTSRMAIAEAEPAEIPHYLSIMDVGCNCSESEGLSNAVMEYMGAGVPCVISRGGGNKDLISHEKNGLLFDVGDSAGLAFQLSRLLDDSSLARRLTNTALQRLEAEMTLPVILQRFDSFYRRITS